ncbi:biotin transporter BioY [Actinobacillus delphinicola]|uniref:Biotin transporter n=1 Tax=Actinobacillus delphinicola TaxID=51161 RepID=A0A448TW16_9PAST|nr:biotin transporter BioY [Actinobacillus delphinicola]VEJ10121.1 Biotin ECF transporter S component BioY2 [Actinobacillus delphinicola]
MMIIQQTKFFFIDNSLKVTAIKAIIGSLFIALLAQVSIPLQPVPITGQTLGVTIVGFAFGKRAGVASVALYLLEGALGLPVFANGSSGIAAFFGPTGGYLYGFLATAYILGYFSDKGILNYPMAAFFIAIIASATTFVFGLFQLSFFVPADKVLEYGFTPFIAGGLLKALIASFTVSGAYKLSKKLDEKMQ